MESRKMDNNTSAIKPVYLVTVPPGSSAPPEPERRAWADLTVTERNGLIASRVMGWSRPGCAATIAYRATHGLGAKRFDGYWMAPCGRRVDMHAAPPSFTRNFDQAWRALAHAQAARPTLRVDGLAQMEDGAVTARLVDGEESWERTSTRPAEALCLALLAVVGVDVANVTSA